MAFSACQRITYVILWYYQGNTLMELRKVTVMTLTVKLAAQEQSRLEVIATAMKSGNQSDVVRTLINEKFESLQADKTLVERRGGHPQYLLDGGPCLSERSNRKSIIAEKMAAKAANRAR